MITKRGKSFSLSKFIEVNGGEEKECKACFKTFSYHFFGTDKIRKDTTNVRCINCVKSNIKVDTLLSLPKIGETKKCIVCREERDLSLFQKRKDRDYIYEKRCSICKRNSITINDIKNINGEKLCSICNEYKPLNEYCLNRQKKDLKNPFCKQCASIKNKINRSKLTPKQRRERARQERIRNKETYRRIKERNKLKETQEQKDKRNEKNRMNLRRRRQEEPLFKLSNNIRSLVKISFLNVLKGNKPIGKGTKDILGIEFALFMKHIESQFLPWMNWENYGKYNGEKDYGWDLDHVVPVSCAKNEEELLLLNHYSNIQPLCSYTNRVLKSNNTPKVCNIIKKEINKINE